MRLRLIRCRSNRAEKGILLFYKFGLRIALSRIFELLLRTPD